MLPLLVLSGLWALTRAHEPDSDPMKNFCRREQHQTCVIDSKLYVDGGLVYYGSGVNNESTPKMSR
jgi:hypothetical protein